MIRPAGPRIEVGREALAATKTVLDGQLDAAKIVSQELEGAAAVLVREAGGEEAWTKADKRWNRSEALLSLIDQVAPEQAGELKASWVEQRRLASTVKSFESLCQRLAVAQRRPEEAAVPAVVPLQTRARQEMLQDLATVTQALKAAGASEAVAKFPLAQLALVRSKLNEQLEALLKLPQQLNPLLNAQDVARPEASGAALGRLLGDAALGQALGAAGARAADPAQYAARLGALALLVDQASSAPDYSITRSGSHYPTSRVAYRQRLQNLEVMYYAESRLDASLGSAQRGAQGVIAAKDPGAALGPLLTERFLQEIGVPPELSARWHPTVEGVQAAVAHELLLPLRALNECVQDMSRRHGHYEELRQIVSDVTQAVVEGRYPEWRRSHPISLEQLAVLDPQQQDQWNSHQVSIELKGAHGGTFKSKEEDGLDLFWVTKIGGPSHGFDHGPVCLMPLLANARTRPIVVEDSNYPHHPVARSYLRLLSDSDGKPVLYLEPLQIDFVYDRQHQEVSTDIQSAIVKHARAKAQALGVPLSLDPNLDRLLTAQGIEFKKVAGPKYILAPSAGLVEASDTLTNLHDWVQTKSELLDFGLREKSRLVIAPEKN